MSAPLTMPVLCRRCTGDTYQDLRDQANPGNVCVACGWDSRKDRDCDLATFKAGPSAPLGRQLGAESVPVLMAEIRKRDGRIAKLETALNDLYPGLALDLRMADPGEDDVDALRSRVKTIEDALAGG